MFSAIVIGFFVLFLVVVALCMAFSREFSETFGFLDFVMLLQSVVLVAVFLPSAPLSWNSGWMDLGDTRILLLAVPLAYLVWLAIGVSCLQSTRKQ